MMECSGIKKGSLEDKDAAQEPGRLQVAQAGEARHGSYVYHAQIPKQVFGVGETSANS